MATYAFYNIGQANKEITRLASRVAELEAAKPADQSAQLADAVASNDLLSAELTSTKNSLTEKVSALETASTELAGLKTANAKLSADLETAKKSGSAQALQITGAQGQPPIAVPTEPTAGAGDITAQLQAETDPVKRAKLFQANRKALISEALKR